ncbi:MlaD family protein [Nocardia sp. NPDC051570]|uniref:MlaD family protein n=1 Tax=Nocardia sp. NPDC051570 TaxID=3364324 RepID=UPI0037AE077A
MARIFVDPSGRLAGARTLRLRGVVVLAVLAAALLGARWGAHRDAAHQYSIRIETNSAPIGVDSGTPVRYRGVRVGRVETIDLARAGQVRLAVTVDPAHAATMPAGLGFRYVPSNLFGPTEIELVGPDRQTGPLARESRIVAPAPPRSTQPMAGLSTLASLVSALDPPAAADSVGVLTGNAETIAATLNNLLTAAQAVLDQPGTAANAGTDLRATARLMTTLAPNSAALADLTARVLTELDDLAARDDRITAVLGQGVTLSGLVGPALTRQSAALGHLLDDGAVVVPGITPLSEPLNRGLRLAPNIFDALFPLIDGKPTLSADAMIDTAPPRVYGPADCPVIGGRSGDNCPAGPRPEPYVPPIVSGRPVR